LAKQLRDYIAADNAKTKTSLPSESTCIVFVWNGNEFEDASYKANYSGDIQAPEIEQLKFLVSLSTFCPRFAVVPSTDNTARGLGPGAAFSEVDVAVIGLLAKPWNRCGAT
jgi:hypothetical protein